MATERRPELRIKVFPEDLVNNNKLQILQKLRKTNALILNLTENIKGNVFNQPFPFITFQRVSSSEQLPKNLKLDGDPWSDFFITLNSFKHQSYAGSDTYIQNHASLLDLSFFTSKYPI